MLRHLVFISIVLGLLSPALPAQAQGACVCCDGETVGGRVLASSTCTMTCQTHQGPDFFRLQSGGVTDLTVCPPESVGGQLEAAAKEPKAPVVGFGNPLCPNPRQVCDIPSMLGRIIKAVLGIVGAIGLVMFIWGGFLWMTGASRGEKNVRYAKEVLVWSTLGLLVIFSSYLIVNFIIRRLEP